MDSPSSEYDDIRHDYDDAFHRWSQADASPAAQNDYHRLRDRLARYILEHAAAVQRTRPARNAAAQHAPVNGVCRNT